MSGGGADPRCEAELIRRARGGDQEALAQLLRLWQPSLESIARALQRRHGRLGFETHDLVQTSIRRLLGGRGVSLENDSDLGLLQHILREVYAEKVRGEMRRRRRETASVQGKEQHELHDIPEEWQHGLNPEEWELVLLWKQGMSWAQISTHLGIPAETARKRWHRLMRRLRERASPSTDAAASESGSDPSGARGEDPPFDRAAGPDPPPDPPASTPPPHPA